LTSLSRLYHALGRYEDLLAVMRLELELTEARAAKVELWYKLGELYEHRLADDNQAISCYRQAVELDPTHAPSLRALTHELERARDYEALCQTLQAQLDAAREPGDKARIAYRLGELYEVHLDRLDKAEAAYAKAVDAVPTFRPARMAMARVESHAQNWLHVADALAREADQSSDPRTSIELLLRAGQIWNELLAQPEQATACYEQVLNIDDKNLAALLALETLYRQAGAWEALADVYARQAAVRRDPRARITALEELARVQENVATPSERVRSYQAILALDGAHPGALEGLERLARLLGDYGLLADVDARAARAFRQPTLVSMHQARLGRALEGNNPEMALASYRSALAGDAESLAAIRGLGRVAERLGDHAGVVDALRREAQWTRDHERGGKLLVRAASLCLERLGDPVGALVDAERALERFPDSEEAARLLRELLREDSERLLTVLSRAASAARDPARIGALWRSIAKLYANERGDVPSALSALGHVLEDEKQDAATMQLYGELLVKSRQYHEGVEAFRKALMLGPSRDQAAQLYMTLARLYVDRFGDTRGASEALESLLRIDRRHRDAMTMLLELYAKGGDETGRRRTLTRMLEDARAPSETTWTLLELGRLDLHTGRTPDAAASLRRAVAIEGALGEAATLYKQILGTGEPWDHYAEALKEHIVRVQRGELEDARLRETYLALASTQHEVLLQTDRALHTLREAMVTYPRDIGIHLELADRLSAIGRLDEAIVEYRNIVSTDPTRVEGWRGMARAFHEGGRKLEAAVALAPVSVLGAATTIEAGMARQRRVNPGRVAAGTFGTDVLEKLSAGDRRDEARVIGLLSVLGEALPKLYPIDLERYGATSRDRLGDHPLKKQVLELATAFGIVELDVYLHRAPMPDVTAELTQPPALMVPQLVADSKEAERVFLLGRPLSLIARGLHPAATLGPRELGRLIAATLQGVAPGYGHERYPLEELRELHKRLQKVLSRRGRKALEPVVQQYLEDPPIDFERWVASVPLSSTRAAALLANDLPGAVQAIRRASADHARLDGAPLVQRSPVVADLMRFWTSDVAFEVRRSAGIL
ncbi:MAG TPA: tetratricopeptide repeat protein, partial [Polyangiaceae bacterium]|nr:tetratricopeptide repeat protein [Polyangiaceae bacterium]